MVSILQYYYSLRVNKIFDERAELAPGNMKPIARRTEQDTASLQIIALVTVMFPPGTFVAVIASSSYFAEVYYDGTFLDVP